MEPKETCSSTPRTPTAVSLDAVIGGSEPLQAVLHQVERLLRHQSAARRLPPILILGETGTGKGLLARAIHGASQRANGPFVAVNCAAIPDSLLEGELFGFERGAFTDARQAKPGLFQTAHGGTLFLDEIGALTTALQAKLLTAFEDRAIRRLGSVRNEPVDIWTIAATSEHLPTAVRHGRFREDFYHRLSALTLTLPPLRERGADILHLADHFLASACREYGLPAKGLSCEARAALLGYPWPGNVRELANTIERAALLVDETTIPAAALGVPAPLPELVPASPASPSVLRGLLGAFERSQILAALESAAWNTSRAAGQLGVPRNTLRYRMKRYGLGRGARNAAVPRPLLGTST